MAVNWTKEALEAAIVDSNTYSDVLKKLGLKQIGRNNKTLQKYLLVYGLEFISKPHLNRSYANVRMDDELLFVSNSQTARSVVRRRILKDELIPYQCAKCSVGAEWNGMQLTLQLEHKNGVNNDHRLENLEFLCPNCHSQTDSWAGRNTQKVQQIERKPLIVSVGEVRSKSPFTAEELSKLLTQYTLTDIGKRFNITGNAVRRWCKKWSLDLPGRGYKGRILNPP